MLAGLMPIDHIFYKIDLPEEYISKLERISIFSIMLAIFVIRKIAFAREEHGY